MSSRRVSSAAVALLVLVGVQTAYGTPLRGVAEVRAAKCCADVCRHGAGSKGAARHCCGVGQDDPGVFAAAKDLRAPASSVALLATEPLALCLPASERKVDVSHPPGRAAPLFLLTQTLRL